MLFRKEDRICPPNSPETITGFFQNHPYIADRRGLFSRRLSDTVKFDAPYHICRRGSLAGRP